MRWQHLTEQTSGVGHMPQDVECMQVRYESNNVHVHYAVTEHHFCLRHQLCLMSFPCGAGELMFFRTQCSVKFLPPSLIKSNTISRHAHNTQQKGSIIFLNIYEPPQNPICQEGDQKHELYQDPKILVATIKNLVSQYLCTPNRTRKKMQAH